jgi:hypothetical protein
MTLAEIARIYTDIVELDNQIPDSAENAERDWINHYVSRGCDLLNINGTPSKSFQPTVNLPRLHGNFGLTSKSPS